MATRDANSIDLDAAGNTLSDPVLNLTFDYGDQNRMIKSYSGGTLQASYSYGGTGQRVKKIENAGSQRAFIFHYGSGGRLLGETVYDAIGNKIEERV